MNRPGESGNRVQAIALQDVTVLLEGRTARLARGETYTLAAAEAVELARAGYVQIATAPPAVPAVERAVDAGAAARERAVGAAQKRRR